MQNLLSPDSMFMRGMSRVGDLLILNFCFLLTCIPIVTIGAASTALYTVCFRFETERETYVIRSYFRAFRDNWKQATMIWLILVLCGGTACVNAYLFYCMSGIFRYAALVFPVLLALVLLTASYAFPLLSQFENSVLSTLKNALALSLGFLPQSILMTALNIFPFIVLLTNTLLFFQTAFLWAIIYFSAAAYLNAIVLKKTLKHFLSQEEET